MIKNLTELLEEHYGLQVGKGKTLPLVDFHPRHRRAYRFNQASYLFQYNHRHFSPDDITSCMRFLLHGMSFETRNGEIILITAHLLRHGLATYAAQIEKVPVDIAIPSQL